MSDQIKSLEEVLLPSLEGKNALLLLDRNQKVFSYLRILAVKDIVGSAISIISLGLLTETLLKFVLTSILLEYLIFMDPCEIENTDLLV